jgi:hypothetical protein
MQFKTVKPAIELFPVPDKPAKILLRRMRLLWQTAIFVLSTNVMPVHLPNDRVACQWLDKTV